MVIYAKYLRLNIYNGDAFKSLHIKPDTQI